MSARQAGTGRAPRHINRVSPVEDGTNRVTLPSGDDKADARPFNAGGRLLALKNVEIFG